MLRKLYSTLRDAHKILVVFQQLIWNFSVKHKQFVLPTYNFNHLQSGMHFFCVFYINMLEKWPWIIRLGKFYVEQNECATVYTGSVSYFFPHALGSRKMQNDQ